MASIGHIFVGMAAGRHYCRRQPTAWPPAAVMAVWAALSLGPDLDVCAFALHIPYEAPWGHRGATHSLVFATGIAALAGLMAKAAKLDPWRTALVAEVVVASHGLLDAMTDGGLGSALLWP